MFVLISALLPALLFPVLHFQLRTRSSSVSSWNYCQSAFFFWRPGLAYRRCDLNGTWEQASANKTWANYNECAKFLYHYNHSHEKVRLLPPLTYSNTVTVPSSWLADAFVLKMISALLTELCFTQVWQVRSHSHPWMSHCRWNDGHVSCWRHRRFSDFTWQHSLPPHTDHWKASAGNCYLESDQEEHS